MRILKWIGRGLVALLGLAAIAYPAADMLRVPLDDTARSALIGTGKADRFVLFRPGSLMFASQVRRRGRRLFWCTAFRSRVLSSTIGSGL